MIENTVTLKQFLKKENIYQKAFIPLSLDGRGGGVRVKLRCINNPPPLNPLPPRERI